MLRRTLVLFTALTLMGLVMVLVYAWFNVDSARDAVVRAEALLERDRSADAVELLYDAEQSSGGRDPDLLRRILRSRYQAHDQLGNFKHARADLERLLALGERSLDLELDRVRILRGDGDQELARTEALRLVEENPHSAPCLQAAGECVQFAYQAELKKILDGLLERLPSDDSLRARRLMLVFLYRSATDAEAQAARAELDELIRERMPNQAERARLDSRITQIIHGIAQSVDYYRRALLTGMETSPAFRGLSWTLIQQGRIDDAALLAQIQVLRFDSALSGYAAERGAQLHARQGRHAEAIRIIDTWKRGRTCTEQHDLLEMDRHGGLDAAVEAWTRAAQAMFELARVDDLRALVTEFFELEAYLSKKHGSWDLIVHDRYLFGLQFFAEKSWDAALGRLEDYVKSDERIARRTVDEVDRFADVMELLHHAAKQAGRTEKQLDILSQWIRQRPDDPKPYALRARDFEDAGQLGMALHDLRACVRLDPESDGYLMSLLAVAERIHGQDGMGSQDLLHGMLRFPGTNLFPQPPDSVLFLGVAEEALRRGSAQIAVENARAAMNAFPRSRPPRRAYVRAHLLAGNPRQAITEMEALRVLAPPTTEDLELLLEARKKNQRPVADVERDLLVQDSSLRHAPTLMRHCLARGAHREVLAIGERFLAEHGDRGDALLALGVAELELRNEERALELFARIPEEAAERLEAVERSLFVRARSGPPEECSRLAAEFVRLAGDAGETLVRAGMRLADLGAVDAALVCLVPVLEDKRFVELRTAKLLTRIAELLLAAAGDEFDDHPRAEILLEGAISMENGGRAKVLLAMLYAAQGRFDEADEVYSFPQTDPSIPVDVHIGLLIRLGRRPAAIAEAQQLLATRPADYVLLALRAIASVAVSDGSPVIAPGKSTGVPELDQLVVERPMELLDILSLPRLEGFANRLTRAEALLRESRGNPWVPFFVARARELQGDWKNAIGFLSKLLADEPRFYPAYDEAYRLQAEHDPAALSDPALLLEYVKPALAGLPGMSAGMVSRAIYLGALRELAGGNPATASRWKLVAWMMEPRSFAVGRDLALEAIAGGRTGEALPVLELLWNRVPEQERPAFHDLYFQAALSLIEATDDASLRARARTRAEQVLRETGIHGYALHFLADTDPAGADSIPTGRLIEHVRYLMDRKQSPAGDLRGITRSLQLLVSRTGGKAVIPLLDELVAADPSLFELWLLRAKLLAREGRAQEAADSLLWILDYVEHPTIARELLSILASADLITARAEKLIRRNIPPEPVTREDRASLGLIAWRRADHFAAVRLLEGHPSALSSLELYARASALISLGRPDDLELAADDLEEIDRRGPGSTWAQEAGFLAHQIRMGTSR